MSWVLPALLVIPIIGALARTRAGMPVLPEVRDCAADYGTTLPALLGGSLNTGRAGGVRRGDDDSKDTRTGHGH